MKIYDSITQIIGNTPLCELKNIEKHFKLNAHIIAKLEMLNPGGSAKDRVAYQMICDKIECGELKKDSVIIEPTSGNTGIGLCMVAAQMGYKCIIVMPGNMSAERIKVMSGYGAKVILTDASLGMKGAIKKAEELNGTIPNSVIMGQFENPSNPFAHFNTTGPEIWRDTDGMIDTYISAVGTGGTLSGGAKYLKEQNSGIEVVAVEPEGSAVLSGKAPGPHKIQGIGGGFVPDTLDMNLIDKIITCPDEEAFNYSRLLCKSEGISAGISSGAALYAGVMYAKMPKNKGKNIVIILPDTGMRYLSTELFD